MEQITYADFCAGIGGFRYALDSLNWSCEFSCEINPECEITYRENFGSRFDHKDVTTLKTRVTPQVDVLCAGFPCQPFSIAGKRLGVQDERANILPSLIQIALATQPKVLFLENVPNLLRHNNGATISAMMKDILKAGYIPFRKILDSTYFGIPQSRPRLFIVAFRKDLNVQHFQFPKGNEHRTPFRPFIAYGDHSIPISNRWQQYIDLYCGRIDLQNMSFTVPKTRRRLEKINPGTNLEDCIFQLRSSGIRALNIDDSLPTFAVSVSGGGAMIPVYSRERRHLSILEIKRIMGFPDSFKFPIARTHAIKQLANAVCPPVVKEIGYCIQNTLNNPTVYSFDQKCLQLLDLYS